MLSLHSLLAFFFLHLHRFVNDWIHSYRCLLFQKCGLDYIKKEDADVFCIQETKCTTKDIPVKELEEAGFSAYFLSGDKAGYSGVGIIYKNKPINITEGIS